MRRIVFAALCTALPFVALPSHAEAHVLVRVDRATQTMDVSVDGASLYRWPVSTGRRVSEPRPARSVRSEWRRADTRRFTTTRRCRMRSSFTAASPSTAVTTLRGWADPRPTAASACIQALRPHCSVSCSAKARTTPQLWCTSSARAAFGGEERRSA